MRYGLGCSHLLITFPFPDQVLLSFKWTWSPMFSSVSFLCFLVVSFEALSWYVGHFILGSNIRNSRSISFVAGDWVFSLPGAMRKTNNARSLSSPDFRHFNRVLLTICIILSTMPFDYANSGLQVTCSKSQFVENFLNSNKVIFGPLSEKNNLGILCFGNIAFIFFFTIEEVLLRYFLISKYLE